MDGFIAWFATNVWPNLFASILWAVPALIWQHRRVARRLRDHHAELRSMLFEDDEA